MVDEKSDNNRDYDPRFRLVKDFPITEAELTALAEYYGSVYVGARISIMYGFTKQEAYDMSYAETRLDEISQLLGDEKVETALAKSRQDLEAGEKVFEDYMAKLEGERDGADNKVDKRENMAAPRRCIYCSRSREANDADFAPCSVCQQERG